MDRDSPGGSARSRRTATSASSAVAPPAVVSCETTATRRVPEETKSRPNQAAERAPPARSPASRPRT